MKQLRCWVKMVWDTKKPPEGGFIESKKVFSGTSSERQKSFSGDFHHCRFAWISKHKQKFSTPVYVAWPPLQLVRDEKFSRTFAKKWVSAKRVFRKVRFFKTFSARKWVKSRFRKRCKESFSNVWKMQQGGFSANRTLACPINNKDRAQAEVLILLRGAPNATGQTVRYPSMRYDAIIVSLLLALLNTYSGGEGMNFNAIINAPVTVIHSKWL